MIPSIEVLFWFSFGMLCYIFVGYPVVLLALCAVVPAKKVKKEPIRPRVSLIISCYNEAQIIEEKINNSLALDYPKDILQIVVVSDASSDSTDDIVTRYAEDGVILLRQEERLGKTTGLNSAVEMVDSDVIVFSDANAMYQEDAISKLVENFADETVGYVVGYAKYTDGSISSSAKNETAYWNYEGFVKKWESRLHSVVGGDGAIYAIRRGLYTPLLATDINDFVNPLQIICKGYRGIYEPGAVCFEETAGSFLKEINRKKRIVNRSFAGLLRVRAVMNPFVTGLFSWQVISHKLLRWFTPLFLFAWIGSCIVLGAFGSAVVYQVASLCLSLFLIFASVGSLFSESKQIPLIVSLPYYFMAMNSASFSGVVETMRGRVAVTWSTPREHGEEAGRVKMKWLILLLMGLLMFLWASIGNLFHKALFLELTLFWLMAGLIVYGYIGYPLVIATFAKLFKEPVLQKEITPSVDLLICAYNEEEVIEEKILNCIEIDYPADKLRIIIASDGSEDKTNQIVEKYAAQHPQLVFYPYPKRCGKIGVINKTVHQLVNEIVVFSDANTMYKPDAIKKLVRKFHDPSVGGVSADVILVNDETQFGEGESAYYRYERWVQRNESFTGSIVGADGGMYAIRRELFLPPSSNVILDDLVISLNVVRQGYRLVYEKSALAYELNVNSSKSEFLRRSRVIAGGVQVLKQREGIPLLSQTVMVFKYLSHKVLRWILPLCLVAILLLNIRIVVGGNNPLYGATLAVQIMFYVSALMGHLYKSKGESKVLELPYYFCLSNSAALYGLYKGVFNKQSVTWQIFRRKSS